MLVFGLLYACMYLGFLWVLWVYLCLIVGGWFTLNLFSAMWWFDYTVSVVLFVFVVCLFTICLICLDLCCLLLLSGLIVFVYVMCLCVYLLVCCGFVVLFVGLFVVVTLLPVVLLFWIVSVG